MIRAAISLFFVFLALLLTNGCNSSDTQNAAQSGDSTLSCSTGGLEFLSESAALDGTGEPSLEKLNTEIIQSARKRSREQSSGTQAGTSESLRDKMRARARLLAKRLETEPESFDRVRLPSDIGGQLPFEATECLEQPLTVEGELEVLAVDYPDRPHEIRHVVTEASGRRHRLLMRTSREWKTGARVRVRGTHIPCVELQGGEQPLTSPLSSNEGTDTVEQLEASALSNTFGQQHTAVILVSFQDQPTTYTAADVQNIVFTKVNQFWQENSFQQTWITGQAFGPYTIPLSKSVCDSTSLANYAKAAAANAGVDLSKFQRHVFAFPKNGCSWYGLGTIGGVPSKAWLNASLTLFTTAHELGHNLGLYHANALNCGSSTIGSSCSTIEYGDTTDVMGNKVAGHYNSFQKERLGWLNASGMPPIQSVSTSGTYVIEPYSAQAFNPKTLKILKSSGSSSKTYYYVEYRQASGFDGVFSNLYYSNNLTSGVVVHTGSTSSGNSSYLLNMSPSLGSWYKAALTPGQSFTDPNAGVSISLLSQNGNAATVQVDFAGSEPAPCARANPTVTLSPVKGPAVASGTAVSYNVTVKNNDSSSCPAANFTFKSAGLGSGWSTTFSPNAFAGLAPGHSKTTSLTVVSPLSASASTSSFNVTATSDAGGSDSASGSYTVAPPGALTVAIAMGKRQYSKGEEITIPIEAVFDNGPATGAGIAIEIIQPNGTRIARTGIASTGSSLYTFRAGDCTQPGNYVVEASANMDGKTATNALSFEVL